VCDAVIAADKGGWEQIKPHTRVTGRSTYRALWASLLVSALCVPSCRAVLACGLERSQRAGYARRRTEQLDPEVELAQDKTLSGVQLRAGKSAARDAPGPEGRGSGLYIPSLVSNA
jgi:hypothetical protein